MMIARLTGYGLIKVLRFASLFLMGCLASMPIMALPFDDAPPPPDRPQGPCDIYGAAGTPCVTAHSTTRALYANYTGPLYQVERESDGKTLDIGLVKPAANDAGGYADAAAQDAFCAGTVCYISKIYDQSGKGNDLTQAPGGTFKGPAKGAFNHLPIADMAPVTISGHKAYGVYIIPGMGLRNNDARGLAINDEPEGIYYVIDGKHYSSGCCFDYGNSSTNSRAVGTGTMETTYYGTATAWGSGNGNGPWIMADMEAGLFSGYNAKKNDVPAIDSWKFVSAFVDGGGGNKWDLRGGNAQEGKLTTFYSGVRPGTPERDAYFPMNKKGAVLLGNGGDNGNGSAGTFYEGVMTTGFPTEATTDAVQANIVAAGYKIQPLSLSRATTFTPKSSQDITLIFNNTTGASVGGATFSMVAPKGWSVRAVGGNGASKAFTEPIAPNASVSVTFEITGPEKADAGFVTGKVAFGNRSETITQRVRTAPAVKINEIRVSTGTSLTDQFIELYNASDNEVDISNWSIINTPAQWASVKLGTIPAGTKLRSEGFYLLGLANSGLLAPAKAGDNRILVESVAGMSAGQQVNVGGESHTIAQVGTAASPKTTLFIPVSQSSWLSIPAGATSLPVTSAAGFAVGEKIGIDLGGNYEVATVTGVGKAATQTNLAGAAKAGDLTIKVLDNASMTEGDSLTINTGARVERVKIKRIVNVYTAPPRGGTNGQAGEVELTAPLKLDHMDAVDVYSNGTGISFTPATRFVHKSGDALQALGSGIMLEGKLAGPHEVGAPVMQANNTSAGYQGTAKPDQWFGYPLSITAGSIALMDPTGKVLIDGVVFGSEQTNSSANGWVSSPAIATLEGDQHQGGCMAISPTPVRNGVAITGVRDQSNRSMGLFPDGADHDNNCQDFHTQNAITLAAPVAAGSNNIKVATVTDFSIGQQVVVGSGANSETALIAMIGTPGATSLATATEAGVTTIPVSGVAGFSEGQTITVGSGGEEETAVIAAITAVRRRFGAPNNTPDTITLKAPLTKAHAANTSVSGTGITLTTPLSKPHENGDLLASDIPTPGAPNRYVKKKL